MVQSLPEDPQHSFDGADREHQDAHGPAGDKRGFARVVLRPAQVRGHDDPAGEPELHALVVQQREIGGDGGQELVRGGPVVPADREVPAEDPGGRGFLAEVVRRAGI